MPRIVRALAPVAVVCGLAAVAWADPFVLRDVRQEAGLGDVVAHDSTWIGVAVAFVDLDGDLWPDLYFGAGHGERDWLCLNTRDGRFRCQEVGPKRTTVALAIAAGDYDNDGDLDLYVMNGGPNVLLRNDGGGQLTDVTAAAHAAGMAGGVTPTGTFFDYDGDGRLDLYLGGGDVGLDGNMFAMQVLGQRPDGTFSDVTAQAGLALTKNTLSMMAFDYDADLRQDLMITGNFGLVTLYHNDGGGRFSDVTASQPQGFRTAVTEGMGLDIADFDGDGTFDIYATNSVANPNNPGSGFFVNRGDGTFDSKAADYGVLADFAWGTGWADLDDDTWPDLIVVGNTAPHDFVYQNVGGKSFTMQPLPRPQGGTETDCYTVALADYDRDGRVDALVATLNGAPPQLLHNETPPRGGWISVYLTGAAQRDPIGALVEVTAGDRVLRRQLLSQTSKGAQGERSLHFGVGAATLVDVTVRWPGGGTDRVTGVPVNAPISIEEGCSGGGAAWPGQCDAVVKRPPPPLTDAGGCAYAGRAAVDRGALAVVLAALLVATRRRLRAGRRPGAAG